MPDASCYDPRVRVRTKLSDGEVLFSGEGFTLKPREVVQQGKILAEVGKDGEIHTTLPDRTWTWSAGAAEDGGIVYEGPFPVLSAAYDLAVRELKEGRNEDGRFATGAAWPTMWTRDVSYSVHLALAMADCEGSMETLEERVSANGEIEQDTGTGGAWPISTDRVVWGVAAWEVYLMSGDRGWLEFSCRLLEETCLHDDTVIQELSGLMRGETSFLDWREQSYPDWMTPSDIGGSSALSTMALHCRVRGVLAEMYEELDKPERAAYWGERRDLLSATIQNLFWMPYHGQYGQFIYGRGYPVLSERTDSLGECLSVLFGVAEGERAKNVVSGMPRCAMGLPCFYPMKSEDTGAYHNEGVWPFVEGYYVQAASMTGNEEAVLAGLSSLVRSALVHGTNKENFHVETGFAEDMLQSSCRQLWSIAGMLGSFYKGLFGLTPGVRGMEFRPCLPESLAGRHELKNVRFRGMTFDVAVSGYGSVVESCRINDEEALPFLPVSGEGHFSVEIKLSPSDSSGAVNWVSPEKDLPMPEWDCRGNELSWYAVPEADYYRVYRNGIPVAQTEATMLEPLSHSNLSHYQVMAATLDGKQSFLNEPREYVPCDARLETRPCGLTGDDVWVSRLEDSDHASFYDVVVSKPGVYRIDAYFANGTGSFRDGNTCALRSLLLNGERVGSLVFPHLSEAGEWDRFGYSPGLEVVLRAGQYKVQLAYQAHDENTNCFVNDVLIKSVRFTRIND